MNSKTSFNSSCGLKPLIACPLWWGDAFFKIV
jgi:hypothetical protein